MTPLRERLRRETGAAGRRHAAVDAEIDRRRDRPLEPGDLYLLSATAEHAVEWAILDRDPADPRRLLAVPADTNSLVGSADVAVREDAPRGCLSLRCAYPVWLDAGAFDPEMRTGLLEPETLERARCKHGEVERGTAFGSFLEREIDGEADYREWLEVLEQARAAAIERGAEPRRESAAQGAGKIVALRPSRWRSTAWPLAIAASVLLVVNVVLVRQRSIPDQRGGVIDARLEELARQEQEQRLLKERHRRELARLEDERRRTEHQREQRIAELEAALEASARPKAVTNLPLVVLALGQLRGGGDSVEVAPDASHLMLILQVDDPETYSGYRLDIREQDTEREIWRDSGLVASRLSELTVLLPRGLMPAGRYELRLHGLRGDLSEQLMERILTIENQHGGTDERP